MNILFYPKIEVQYFERICFVIVKTINSRIVVEFNSYVIGEVILCFNTFKF